MKNLRIIIFLVVSISASFIQNIPQNDGQLTKCSLSIHCFRHLNNVCLECQLECPCILNVSLTDIKNLNNSIELLVNIKILLLLLIVLVVLFISYTKYKNDIYIFV